MTGVISGDGIGRRGDCSGSGIGKRAIEVVDLLIFSGEIGFGDCGMKILGESVNSFADEEVGAVYVLLERVGSALGAGAPKAIGRRKLPVDGTPKFLEGPVVDSEGGGSVPGACDNRKPICTVADDTTEEFLMCPLPRIRGGGWRSDRSYWLLTLSLARSDDLNPSTGNREYEGFRK
jgi:hypothetical protein